MEKLHHKVIGYLVKHLTYFYDDGFSLKNFRTRIRFKKESINYNRYKLFDKKWLLDYNIHTIIDIGANVGEFTMIFAELFPNATVYAFEPLPNCYSKLISRSSGNSRIKSYNIGVGDKKCTMDINQSSWHPASSFRKMGDLHKGNYPHSAGSKAVSVRVDTLDSIFTDIELEDNIFIKMDVQGFEDEVIKGGADIFKRAKVVVVECSFKELYEDEPKFHGIYSLLYNLGFEYQGSLKQSIKSDDDSYLQGDCIFKK